MNEIQYLSIAIEAAVAILGLMLVFRKNRAYGWGIFLTFVIYVFYDSAKIVNYQISDIILYLLFFIASVSIFVSVLMIYKDKNSSDKNKSKMTKR